MGTVDTYIVYTHTDTLTYTYIGNDRKLADSTEYVVPNPWT